MSGETYTLKCRVCGREFTVTGARRKGTKYCDECRALVDRMHKRESDKRRKHTRKAETDDDAMRTYFPYDQISSGELASAKKKPARCSDARWRIELRRRANKDYYNYCPAVVR